MSLDTVSRATGTVVPSGVSRGYRMAADAVGGRMYWTTIAGAGIYSANFDGSDVGMALGLGGQTAQGLAIDGVSEKMYYTLGGALRRANLDGSGDELLYNAGATQLQDVQLDLGAGKLYLTEWDGTPSSPGSILSASLDGAGVSTVLANIENGPVSIGLDSASDSLYWIGYGLDGRVGGLHRVGTDGSGLTTLLRDVDGESLALDLAGGKAYWATPNQNLTGGTIARANLDGSDYELLTLPAGSIPTGLAIVPEPGAIALLAIGAAFLARKR